MSTGCLTCCKILCCCFIVCTSIVTFFTGLTLALLGVLFTWGFSIMGSALDGLIGQLTGSLTSSLKSQLGIDINILDLLRNISSITGTMGIVLLVAGILLLVFSCVGACGACCTVVPCLVVYAVAVLVLFLAQLTLVIIWFANAELLKGSVKTTMENNVKQFAGIKGTNVHSVLQNLIQIFVGCCGVTNGTDFYQLAPNWNREYNYTAGNYTISINLTYPISCCKFDLANFSPQDPYCMYNNTTPETNNYQIGCYTQLFAYIDTYFAIDSLFYALGGLLLYQLLLGIGAIVIIYADRQSNKVTPK